MSQSEIYDLGYRHYQGPRLGRGYALRSLCVQSVRSIFGLGRGVLPKFMAFGLAALAFVPAIVQVVLGAVAGGSFEFIEPQEFYGVIQMIMVLFVAAMASDLVGNDRRYQTLALYYSRPIRRDDYALAKLGSLAIALLAMTLLPQVLAFVGNWLGASDSTQWFGDNASDLFWIALTSILVSAQLAAVGLLLVSWAERRSFSMMSVIGSFVGLLIAASVLVELLSRTWGAVATLLSPLHVMNATSLVLFDALPSRSQGSRTGDMAEVIAYVDLPAWAWPTALVVQTLVAASLVVYRYRREQ